MITGNITISSRPREEDCKTGICPDCCEEVTEVGVDESFDDQFGLVTCWGTGCPNCGGAVYKGQIVVDRMSTHIARKDHMRGDRVIVPKGAKYRYRYVRGWYEDEENDYKHEGFVKITKRVLS